MRLNTIQLLTNDITALSVFYKEVLELPVGFSGDGSLRVSAGSSQINFKENKDVENPFYHFAFNIPSNKFDEAYNLIKEKVTLLWLEDYKSYIADFKNWNAKSFYFEDPAGNILEMISRFDINDFSNEPFSSKQIRNISEIGLVFSNENFDEEVNKFLQKFELSYFENQPPLPHFRAVGNDEGLFIIVPEKRVWFATRSKRSGIFPMEIEFTIDKEKFIFKEQYRN